MSTDDFCLVCKQNQVNSESKLGDKEILSCARCGRFEVSGSAQALLNNPISDLERARISGWVYDQNFAGAIAKITADNLGVLRQRKIPSVKERADRLLIEAARDQETLDIRFDCNEPRFFAATYSSDIGDVQSLLSHLADCGFVDAVSMGGGASLTVDGLMAVDELRQNISESVQGFVAMWFHKSLEEPGRDGIERAILDAGYNPLRIDSKEFVNKIDDEIIAEINASRFLVADFTEHRGGVYFEAGYALGRGLPVIWTCREDHLRELHFDIRQYNCITWSTTEELYTALHRRIRAILGDGPIT